MAECPRKSRACFFPPFVERFSKCSCKFLQNGRTDRCFMSNFFFLTLWDSGWSLFEDHGRSISNELLFTIYSQMLKGLPHSAGVHEPRFRCFPRSNKNTHKTRPKARSPRMKRWAGLTHTPMRACAVRFFGPFLSGRQERTLRETSWYEWGTFSSSYFLFSVQEKKVTKKSAAQMTPSAIASAFAQFRRFCRMYCFNPALPPAVRRRGARGHRSAKKSLATSIFGQANS